MNIDYLIRQINNVVRTGRGEKELLALLASYGIPASEFYAYRKRMTGR